MKNNETAETKDAKKEAAKSRRKKRNRITLIILAAVVAGCLLWTLGISKLIKPGKIEGFEQAVTEISAITIPEGTRIVGLGEATHGNSEFQQLKLDVFRRLVESTNIRGFILEGDMGGCALVNEYIQGGEGTAREMCGYLGYKIYNTKEMCELIDWMREYNAKAPENDKVRLYGNDIQYCTRVIRILKNGYERIDDAKYREYSQQLDQHFGTEEDQYDPSKLDDILAFTAAMKKDIADNKEAYSAVLGSFDYEVFAKALDNLEYYLHYRETEKYSAKYRDRMAKDNVDWALGIEESSYGSGLMLSCHNDHMSCAQATNFTFLGVYLQEEYGDAYFAIGTDFYITEDNIRGNSGRELHTLCSDDPLAYQLKDLPGKMYYLDFSKADKNSALGKKIHSRIPLGTVGEAYSPIYAVYKGGYQLRQVPAEKYDAMILVYEATPIEVLAE
ncbi:MAG: erythromycin esterase family protein [Lachnospiraceae bacterium]|nr:erythromycin esterase family protein [Lachnospiraceae bacterium]